MNATNLGRLQVVDLREVWNDEAKDFTPWLALQPHLDLLGESIGLELELSEQEAAVGDFAADLLCKNIADDTWVLIENQIEKTDHRHLGQILTYAAGLDAKTIVWVSARFTEEHRAALDWLNEHTSDDVSFFGLEVEVWRIGDSLPAPKFNVVCKPNDWSRNVKYTATTAEMTETKRRQLEFWREFKIWAEDTQGLKVQDARPQHWLIMTIGKAGFHVSGIISSEPEIRVELNLNSADAKQQFAALEKQRDSIQSRIDLPLYWVNDEGTKSAKVFVSQSGDFTDAAQRKDQFQWLAKYMKAFRDVFAPLVKQL